MKRNILFLTPYPFGESPSQRFRFEQYFDLLRQNEITFELRPFLTSDWRIFYGSGQFMKKASMLLRGYFRRLKVVVMVNKYEFVFIHREASPLGPPVFEWIISRVFKKKVIYDFDDAIWLTDRENEPLLWRILKWRTKVASICSWSYKVSCGNEYLCTYARRYNKNVILNPTTIDTTGLHRRLSEFISTKKQLVVGWTGSHSTLKYLEGIREILEELITRFPHITIVVIADKPPKLELKKLEFRKWQRETEIQDLSKLDIGIMPLPDDIWSRGKCGFKALQYMAMGIPAVVSPVGTNQTIIDHGVDGFFASSKEEWIRYIGELVTNEELRKTMGKKGREKVEKFYSVTSNSSLFLKLFEKS